VIDLPQSAATNCFNIRSCEFLDDLATNPRELVIKAAVTEVQGFQRGRAFFAGCNGKVILGAWSADPADNSACFVAAFAWANRYALDHFVI
jgi:hypothetical protein